jgi:hypothetical protein
MYFNISRQFYTAKDYILDYVTAFNAKSESLLLQTFSSTKNLLHKNFEVLLRVIFISFSNF